MPKGISVRGIIGKKMRGRIHYGTVRGKDKGSIERMK